VIAVNWWLVGDGKFVVFLLNQCVRAFTVKAAEYKIIYHEFCFIVRIALFTLPHGCQTISSEHLPTSSMNRFHLEFMNSRDQVFCVSKQMTIFVYFISNFWYLNQQIENLLKIFMR
jgi:hypothetical protein